MASTRGYWLFNIDVTNASAEFVTYQLWTQSRLYKWTYSPFAQQLLTIADSASDMVYQASFWALNQTQDALELVAQTDFASRAFIHSDSEFLASGGVFKAVENAIYPTPYRSQDTRYYGIDFVNHEVKEQVYDYNELIQVNYYGASCKGFSYVSEQDYGYVKLNWHDQQQHVLGEYFERYIPPPESSPQTKSLAS